MRQVGDQLTPTHPTDPVLKPQDLTDSGLRWEQSEHAYPNWPIWKFRQITAFSQCIFKSRSPNRPWDPHLLVDKSSVELWRFKQRRQEWCGRSHFLWFFGMERSLSSHQIAGLHAIRINSDSEVINSDRDQRRYARYHRIRILYINSYTSILVTRLQSTLIHITYIYIYMYIKHIYIYTHVWTATHLLSSYSIL